MTKRAFRLAIYGKDVQLPLHFTVFEKSWLLRVTKRALRDSPLKKQFESIFFEGMLEQGASV